MKAERQHILKSLWVPLVFVSVIWAVELVKNFYDWELFFLGIRPRQVRGLLGIVTAPVVHSGWDHLTANTFPLFFLSAGLIYFYRPIATRVGVLIYLATGIWVWAAARPVWHIGASGVIYGLAFFLFFSGVFRKDIRALALALIVAFFYGGMVWGVFPIKPGMSWESHLFGAIAGILAAYYFRHKGPATRKTYEWEYELDEPEADAFEPWNYRKFHSPPKGFKYPEE